MGGGSTAYGVGNTGADVTKTQYVFSPDSKHVAYFCRSVNPSAPNLTFTPDGNHLLWTQLTAQAGFRLIVDGKPVLDGFPASQAGFSKPSGRIWPSATLRTAMLSEKGMPAGRDQNIFT